VWGVSDPPPDSHRGPQPRPRGSLTPHVSQHVSQRSCRRRSTHLCSDITNAITVAAARACDVRCGRRSRTLRRRLLRRVSGRVAPISSHGLRIATSRGSARAAPTCHPSRVTAWRCARRRTRRCASLRPAPAGLRALTAPARSARAGSYVMAADRAEFIAEISAALQRVGDAPESHHVWPGTRVVHSVIRKATSNGFPT